MAIGCHEMRELCGGGRLLEEFAWMQSLSDWQIHYHWGLWRSTKISKLGHWKVVISLYFSISRLRIHILVLRTINKTPICRCVFGSGHLTMLFKTSCFSLGSLFFLFLSSNPIMTLFTIGRKDNTGSTRQDKPRKIPGANACSQKDEKVLHAWWKFMSFIPHVLDQCLEYRFYSIRTLEKWPFWKQRT